MDLARGRARVVVRLRRAGRARERRRAADEADLAVLVLDVELDRVQARAPERECTRRACRGGSRAPSSRGRRASRAARRARSWRGTASPSAPARAAATGSVSPPPVSASARRRRSRPRGTTSVASATSRRIDERRREARRRRLRLIVRDRRVSEPTSGRTLVHSARIGAVVLSDRTIRRLLGEGRIGIDPYDESLLQPSSVDVRVDRYFRVFRNSRYPYINVKEAQEDLTELVEVDGEPFILHPGEFVLGSTLERVTLPDDLVARLEGKSSSRPSRAAHPLDGRLHRPRLGRARDARALERRQPPDHDLPRDEDRAALVRPAHRAGGDAVRLRDDRLEVPGPAGPDALALLAELREENRRRDPRHGRRPASSAGTSCTRSAPTTGRCARLVRDRRRAASGSRRGAARSSRAT